MNIVQNDRFCTDSCNVLYNNITLLDNINSDGKMYFIMIYVMMMVFEYHIVNEAGHREVQGFKSFNFTGSTAMERVKRMFLLATEAARETINAKC